MALLRNEDLHCPPLVTFLEEFLPLWNRKIHSNAIILSVANKRVDFIRLSEDTAFFNSVFPKRFRTLLQSDKTKLILDESAEGPLFREDYFRLLHEAIHRLGIAPKRVIFLTSNCRIKMDYQEWTERTGVESVHLEIFPYHFARACGAFEHSNSISVIRSRILFKRELIKSDQKRARFLTFNRTPRPHRLILIAFLKSNGILDETLFSFSGFTTTKETVDVNRIIQIARNWHKTWNLELEQAILDLSNEKPVELDHPVEATSWRLTTEFAPVLFRDTWISLLTETDFGKSDVDRLTEKVVKPLAGLHPILVLGNPHYWDQLEQWGFLRHPSIIDDHYDNVEDPAERFHIISKEILRLASMESRDLAARILDSFDILEHNLFKVLQVTRIAEQRFLARLLEVIDQ